MKIEKYGLTIDVPGGQVSEVDIELLAYRMNRSARKWKECAFHMKNAIRLLYGPAYIWHEWSDVRFDSLCNVGVPEGHEDYVTWWGSGSCGKSTDAAAFFLADFIAAPNITRTALCSTTRDMLEQRIWGEIIRLGSSVEGLFDQLEYIPNEHAIFWSRRINPRAGLFGIAVSNFKNIGDALGHIQGAHMPRNRLGVDEKQAMKRAIEEARVNLFMSGEGLYWGAGNPVGKGDLLGECAEPLDGWSSIRLGKTRKWVTKKGMNYHFDGLQSPGLKDPGKYPFFMNAEKVERIRKDETENSRAWYSQVRGWILPDELGSTVLTETDIAASGAKEKSLVWMKVIAEIAACDPALSFGGDRCVFRRATVGLARLPDSPTVSLKILLHPYVVIRPNREIDRPEEEQVVNGLVSELDRHDIKMHNFAIDVSGNQRALASLIEAKRGQRGLLRVAFQDVASEMPVDFLDSTPANKVYANRVTELWMTMAQYVKRGNIRGLDDDTISEITSRKLEPVRPMRVQSKVDYREERGESPDLGDSLAILCALLRERMSLLPGQPSDGGKIVTASESYRGLEYSESLAYKGDEFL